MGGRGRGRGSSMRYENLPTETRHSLCIKKSQCILVKFILFFISLNTEFLGLNRGDLPPAAVSPPPLFPALHNKPTPIHKVGTRGWEHIQPNYKMRVLISTFTFLNYTLRAGREGGEPPPVPPNPAPGVQDVPAEPALLHKLDNSTEGAQVRDFIINISCIPTFKK